ncbi:hypothetical protein HG531_005110 [Fusarium graminearum]|nr:hypothetical protein HG531_005110 [Fusarium graminearum]
MLLEDGSQGVDDTESKGQTQHIPVRESQVNKVSCNHLSNTVSIDEASEEGEWDEMALADLGLKIPLSEGEIVDERRDANGGRYTNGLEHALLPEVRTADVSCKDENQDNCENALNGTVDNAESQSLGVVGLPGLNVEGQES